MIFVEVKWEDKFEKKPGGVPLFVFLFIDTCWMANLSKYVTNLEVYQIFPELSPCFFLFHLSLTIPEAFWPSA